uniref:AlNc14C133G7015 protein n=1 Tax=Albugo laibachii Nc14 TaxID=890382 RepID=F0WKG4_9STRA|nr:AlNc14C133G7015 [Albugo laibachii Nc14]|eukprot:CCA21768.1 AlNc14C133G7015 [Albugo laibachii Nc14]
MVHLLRSIEVKLSIDMVNGVIFTSAALALNPGPICLICTAHRYLPNKALILSGQESQDVIKDEAYSVCDVR